VTPGSGCSTATIRSTQIPYDTAQARQLLAEAGWTPGADGILRNAQGQEFRFTLITNAGNDTAPRHPGDHAGAAGPLGIVVTPRLVEWNTMIQTLQSPSATSMRWSRLGRRTSRRTTRDPALAQRGSAVPVRRLLEPARRPADRHAGIVMTDRDAARPLWLEYQRLVVQEAPYMPLYYPKRLTGIRNRVQGVEMDIRGELPTVTRWWIAPRERAPGTTVRSGADTAAPVGAPAN
jgi:peptide/nickel transport system substrate-binding protein